MTTTTMALRKSGRTQLLYTRTIKYRPSGQPVPRDGIESRGHIPEKPQQLKSTYILSESQRPEFKLNALALNILFDPNQFADNPEKSAVTWLDI